MWATLGVGLQRVVQTLAILVLARLLVPEDFGLVAIAVLVLSFASRTTTLGLHTALVQFEGDRQTAADACFIIDVCLTAITLSAVIAASPLATRFFDPRAGSLLALMSLRLIPQALAAVPSALAVKDLNFRKLALIQAAEGLVNAVVAVALAAAGWGPWSLVVGFLTGSVFGTALWWIRPLWIPRWRLNRKVASHLLHEGIRIWSAGNLSYFIDSANRLFIGGMLGLARLGHYEIIGRVVHTPIQTILGIHDRVAVAAFCREHDNRQRVGRWFLRLSGMMLILSSLIAGPLFCFPDILIPTLFGDGWEEAVNPARNLALFTLLAPLIMTSPVYIALKRTSLLLGLTAIRTVTTIGLLFAAAQISLAAVCAVESLSALVFAPINIILVARMAKLPARALLSTMSVPAVGLGAFAAVAFAVRPWVTGALPTPGFTALFGILIPSVAALSLAIFAIRPHLIGEIRSIIAETVGTN
ncbi:MAG: oligosaccharide flippase family protein [Thermoanaerobaculales bacterium]|nr:oligosaccharide flippase family protein [Thermoanaerobaculales bacterium]